MTSLQTLAIVTGVSRREGIGYGIVKALANLGHTIIACARNGEKASMLAAELQKTGANVIPHSLDITSDESVQILAKHITIEYGKLDILVNNAGAGLDYYVSPLNTDFNFTRDALETNLFGTWRMIKAMYPLLKLSKHPRIVNISSGAGSFSDTVFGLSAHPALMTSYGLSKLALNGLTMQFAREFKQEGIIINAVEPGLTATAPGMEAMGARPVAASVPGIIWAATLPDDGPSGGFFRDQQLLAW